MLSKEECLEAYEVIDTLIHLMCGETREDGYEPTMDETINSMRILKQLIDKHFEIKPKRRPKNDHPGVTWDKSNGVWKVRVYVDGKQVNVGSSADFDTAMEIKRLADENLTKLSMEEINRTS